MSIQCQVEHELNLLESADSWPIEGVTLQVATPTGYFEATLKTVDSIACETLQLGFTTTRLEFASVDALKVLSSDLAARLIYLLEPIAPIEVDENGATVQLRSNPPLKNKEDTSYFELLIRRSGIQFNRFQKFSQETRRIVPAQLTREVVARLAKDFSSVLEDYPVKQ